MLEVRALAEAEKAEKQKAEAALREKTKAEAQLSPRPLFTSWSPSRDALRVTPK